MKKKGPFLFIGSRKVYKNPWISVREDKVIHPNGKRGIFGIVETKGGVTILPIDKHGYCYLIKEYTYARRKKEVTLPGGSLDRNETPLKAAKRELIEETGLRSDKWHYLGKVYYFSNIFNTPEHLFLALNVTKNDKSVRHKNGIHIKEDDAIVIRIPFSRLVKMALSGKLDSAERCTAVFRAHHYLQSKKYDFKTGRN